MAEDQKRKKRQQDHGEEMMGHDITDHLYGTKVVQYSAGEEKHQGPENDPNNDHDRCPLSAGAGGTPQAVSES